MDEPFDYRDELGDDAQILACMEQSKYERNWEAVIYWAEILRERNKRDKTEFWRK